MQKKRLISIAVSLVFFIPAVLTDRLSGFFPVYFSLYVLSYAAAGWNVVKKAIINISHGHVFDENFLMLIASVGAFVLCLVFGTDSLFLPGGGEEMMDGAAVMILYQTGEYFQDKAVKKSRKSIKGLLSLRPDSAVIMRDGVETEVYPDEIQPESEYILHPGQKAALDGVVLKGSGYADTSALTGESEPRFLSEGDEILSGFISLDSDLIIKATKAFSESTASRMLRLMEEAAEKKAKQETFISKFAAVYTPIVCGLSLLVAVLPPLLILLITGEPEWSVWIYNALCLLVISCPCALVISVPLTFFGGIGGLASKSVLVKGADCFENIAKADTVAFDKTGTLTTGTFTVRNVSGEDPEYVLRVAASCEKSFSHPVAKSICAAYKGETFQPENVKVHSGKGVSCTLDGKTVLSGNEKLLKEYGIETSEYPSPYTVVRIAEDGKEIGLIECADSLKEGTKEAVADLKRLGIKTVMLTGDRREVAEAVGAEAGIDGVFASLLPEDKTSAIEKLKDEGHKVLYVGDGINDGPALATADAGCAMGALGSDLAVEAADMVIMKDSLTSVTETKKHARKVIRIANENIYCSLAVKAVLMILAVTLPVFPLYIAIIGDVGVCLAAIGNAMRTLK